MGSSPSTLLALLKESLLFLLILLMARKLIPSQQLPNQRAKKTKPRKYSLGVLAKKLLLRRSRNILHSLVRVTSLSGVRILTFTPAGAVEEAVMLMDQQTKRHRGFGFVTFAVEETVDKVCDIHFHTIKNKKARSLLFQIHHFFIFQNAG